VVVDPRRSRSECAATARPRKLRKEPMNDGRVHAGVTAVNGLSFCAEPGRVTGFVGPNGAASTVFELLNTYVVQRHWVVTAHVLVPTATSAAMTAPTATFDRSPARWAGAGVLLGHGLVCGALIVATLRRRDVS
jgi:ABC-type uncharacterized transport system ATPase subunit